MQACSAKAKAPLLLFVDPEPLTEGPVSAVPVNSGTDTGTLEQVRVYSDECEFTELNSIRRRWLLWRKGCDMLFLITVLLPSIAVALGVIIGVGYIFLNAIRDSFRYPGGRKGPAEPILGFTFPAGASTADGRKLRNTLTGSSVLTTLCPSRNRIGRRRRGTGTALALTPQSPAHLGCPSISALSKYRRLRPLLLRLGAQPGG